MTGWVQFTSLASMASINIVEHFEGKQLVDIPMSQPAKVETGTSVRDTVAAMTAEDIGCALVMTGSDIGGIFTERDVAWKVVRQPEVWDEPVDGVMSRDPLTLTGEQTALDALRLMNTRRFRNLPVVSRDGKLIGNLSHYDLLHLASDFLHEHKAAAQSAPENSLLFVNFTGLMVHKPVVFEPSTNLADVVHAMTEAETGLVTIVNERGVVIGEFTEHDLFSKIACQVEDLESEIVGDWMSTEVVATSPRTTVAEGLHLMAGTPHRYMILVSETNHPTGVATFRDITEYVEVAFLA